MPRPKDETPRALGPYAKEGKWRLVFKGSSPRKDQLFDKREAAETFRDKYNADALGKSTKTIASILKEYLTYQNRKGNKQTTIDRAYYHLRSFFPDRKRTLRGITTLFCQKRYSSLTQDKAVDTHRNTLQEVSRFFRWSIKEGYCSKDPTIGIEPEGKRVKGKAQLRIDDARVLYQYINTVWDILLLPNPLPALEALEIRPPAWVHSVKQLPKYKRLVQCGVASTLTALVLGLRASEIVDRTVGDLDDKGRLLHIDASKTEAGKRILVIPDLLRPYLLTLAEGQPKEALLFGSKDRKVPLHWANRLSVKAGLPKMTAHGLRGSFATLNRAQGLATETISKALGHSDIAITKAHYLKPEAEISSNAAQMAESLEP